MSSITSWNRLEPRTRSDDLPGLDARVHDPLWMLARQWQFGEFLAEDTGSPVSVRMRGASNRIGGYSRGGGVAAIDPSAPLQDKVQSESVDVTAGQKIAAGVYFLRLLGKSLATTVRSWYGQTFPLDTPVDPSAVSTDPSAPLVRLTPDGAKLFAALQAENASAVVPPGLAANDISAVQTALNTFAQWYSGTCSVQSSSAWQPSTLSYQFALTTALESASGAGDQTQLNAVYAGGRLDWYSFDVASISPAAAATAIAIDVTAPPTPARFPGMPNSRWWEFEEGAMDFGAIDTAPEDLGRLVLAEYALVYGNDFFIVPLDLALGSVARIVSIEVRNNFGETLAVQADGQVAPGSWRLFRLAKDARSSGVGETTDLFFLPPTLGAVQSSDAVEEVAFLRDEMADMGWAVERVVTGPLGPVNRTERERARQTVPPISTAGKATGAPPVFKYQLSTPVPGNWYPLVPDPVSAVGGVTPARSVVLRLSNAGTALGEILSARELGGASLEEEELPRAGTVVSRLWNYARWTDGSTHVWLGRTREVGAGEGSSGLRFDSVVAKR
jgi:hypothetical protein